MSSFVLAAPLAYFDCGSPRIRFFSEDLPGADACAAVQLLGLPAAAEHGDAEQDGIDRIGSL